MSDALRDDALAVVNRSVTARAWITGYYTPIIQLPPSPIGESAIIQSAAPLRMPRKPAQSKKATSAPLVTCTAPEERNSGQNLKSQIVISSAFGPVSSNVHTLSEQLSWSH